MEEDKYKKEAKEKFEEIENKIKEDSRISEKER